MVGVTLICAVLLLFQDSTYWLCALLSCMINSTQFSSYYHMLAVCIHRFPKLRIENVSNGSGDKYRYDIESLLIWIRVLLLSVPPYMVSARKDRLPVCRFHLIFPLADTVITLTYILILCCLPCFCMVSYYGK